MMIERGKRRTALSAALFVVGAYSFLPSDLHDTIASGGRRALSGGEVPLPPAVESGLADLTEPVNATTDTPVYWHIPKVAGTTMDALFPECLGLVIADGAGRLFGRDKEKSLRAFNWNNGRHVNVDTTVVPGLRRAKSLGLAQSGLADVLYTVWIVPAADVFDGAHRGRLFALFRHPVERAVSMFYYLQDAPWESKYDPGLANMTLKEYAWSRKIDSNWMVRMLTNNFDRRVTMYDLEVAKETLRRKCLVGLLSRMAESAERFDKYLGLAGDNAEKKKCWDNVLDKGHGVNRHKHPKIERGGNEWKALEQVNVFDMKLYEYVEGLFEEQKSLFEDSHDESA